MVEISNGELIDKWTILQIKSEKIQDEDKLNNISNEIASLKAPVNKLYTSCGDTVGLASVQGRLYTVNARLWEVEDKLRSLERDKFWNDDIKMENFVNLARCVYKFNDERANLKRTINLVTNSALVEEKSYEEY